MKLSIMRAARTTALEMMEPLEQRLLFFGSAYHQELTSTAFSFLNSTVLATIVDQHRVQDKVGGNGDIAAYHFDGSYFHEGATTINARYNTILNNSNPDSFNSNTLAVEFGKLNHAVEDFYSHSNWVEVGQTVLVDSGTGFWDPLAPYSIRSGAMLIEGEDQHPSIPPYGTATFSRSGPVVTVSFPGGVTFPGIISGSWTQEKIPDNIEVSHSYLSKDYPTRAYFQPAYDLALQQSQHEFKRLGALIKGRWGDAGVENLLQVWVKPDVASQNAARALLDMPALPPPVQLIPANGNWKYLDDGSNQGTAWRTISFVDKSWKSGNAQFGYGDGDEETVVSYGGSSSNKFITTYFRTRFSVTDAASFSSLTLNLIRDDGAVVYLNGTEVYRSNMPSGSISSGTFASDAIEEESWESSSINSGLLRDGKNVIAVEIHQADLSSSDISFDLKLDGISTTPQPPPPPPPPPPPTSATNLIAIGDTWSYLDNGSNQGTAWRAGTFDDSSWKTGQAQLGYGDGDEATVVGYGGNSSNKFVTTYFRKSFTVADPAAVAALTLRLLRDDGAIVYLNGVEVFRSNMPSGTIDYTTLASNQIETNAWYTSSVSPVLLEAGTNVIAVEIHQGHRTSSDISFDLSLTATLTSGAGALGRTQWLTGSTLRAIDLLAIDPRQDELLR